MVPMVCLAARVMAPISGDNRPDFGACMRFKRAQCGFTLLELLVVLGIVALASIVVIPNISRTESNLLVAQVRQIASAFNYARRIAIVEGAPQVTTIIQITPDDPDYPDLKGEVFQRATIPLLEIYDAEISYQADINEDPKVLDIIELVFFPQGGSTGGILNLSLENLDASIRVDPITGKINIRYPGEEFDEEYF
jgi:general secretion pathway protein H